MQNFTFSSTTTLIQELGAISRIAEICEQCRIQKPFIVTDSGIKKLGLLDSLIEHLQAANVPVSYFSEVVADPPESVVMAALSVAEKTGTDGVIGFGGGSSLDTAKLVALMLRSKEPLQQLYGVGQAKGQRLPLIQIPTTAGTGSEVTPVAIVTTGETTKQGIVATQLLPDIALLDAELTIGLPAAITGMTGVDAMVHAVEAYTSIKKKNMYSDMLAKQALQLMSGSIVAAVENGNNIEARQNMLLGACMAGQAFANAPVAAVHALAYPIGGNYHIPHGLSNSLVLPHVLRFNACKAQQWYSELVDIVVPREKLQNQDAYGGDQLAQYFVELIARLGLPASLSEVEIPESDLPKLAEQALLQQRLLVNNPRTLNYEDALDIYQFAYK